MFGRPDLGLLILRLGFASVLLGYHGWSRLIQIQAWLTGHPWAFVGVVDKLGFPAPVVFALLSALSESIGSMLVAAGFYTRWASAMITISMSVAFCTKFSKGESFELPALYLLWALTITVAGGGRYALERWKPAQRKRVKVSA